MKARSRNKPTKQDSSGSRHRIFIVEDHPVFREGLIRLLELEADLEVCGEAADFEKGLSGIRKHKPDLVLVDLELPGKSGLDLIKKIRALKLPVKLLVVSMYDEALYADRVLRAGGDGYIMKEEGADEIVHAIRDVLDGHIYVSEEVMGGGRKSAPRQKSETEPAARPLDTLSDLELNVLQFLGQGKSNDEIAERLGVPSAEVQERCMEMQKKLRLKTDNALIRYAVCWVETGAT